MHSDSNGRMSLFPKYLEAKSLLRFSKASFRTFLENYGVAEKMPRMRISRGHELEGIGDWAVKAKSCIAGGILTSGL
jgi:hypothetical protein